MVRLITTLVICLVATSTRAWTNTIEWWGQGDGVSWNDPLNWIGFAIPGPNDDAVVPAAFSATTIVFNSGTASARSVVVPRLHVAGGNFSVAQGLSISHGFTYSGGNLNASVLVGNGAVVNAAGGQSPITYTTAGGATFSGQLAAGQTLSVIGPSGNCDATAPATMVGPAFISYGVIALTTAGASIRVTDGGSFENHGLIEITASTSASACRSIAGTWINAGAVLVESGATLAIAGTFENAGEVVVEAFGRLGLGHDCNTCQSLSVNSSSITRMSGGSMGGDGEVIAAGIINLESGLATSSWRLAGGQIEIESDFATESPLVIRSTTVRLIANRSQSAAIRLVGGTDYSDDAILQVIGSVDNYGQIELVTAGNGGDDGSPIISVSTGPLNNHGSVICDAYHRPGSISGGGDIVNYGMLRVLQGRSLGIGINIQNLGDIEVQFGGQLNLSSGLSQDAGSITGDGVVALQGTIHIGGGQVQTSTVRPIVPSSILIKDSITEPTTIIISDFAGQSTSNPDQGIRLLGVMSPLGQVEIPGRLPQNHAGERIVWLAPAFINRGTLSVTPGEGSWGSGIRFKFPNNISSLRRSITNYGSVIFYADPSYSYRIALHSFATLQNRPGGLIRIASGLVDLPDSVFNRGAIEIDNAAICGFNRFFRQTSGSLVINGGISVFSPDRYEFLGGHVSGEFPAYAFSGTQRRLEVGADATVQRLVVSGTCSVARQDSATTNVVIRSGRSPSETATLRVPSDFVNHGTIVFEGGSVSKIVTDAGAPFVNYGVVDGAVGGGFGRIEATVHNYGSIRLGAPLPLIVAGDFVQASGGVLTSGFVGNESSERGRIQVTGSAVLDGSLIVECAPRFDPPLGEALSIMTAASGLEGSVSNAYGCSLASLEVDSNSLSCVFADGSTGDISGDGVTNGVDLGILLLAWGDCQYPCVADLNLDGVVDSSDLSILLGSWGNGDWNTGLHVQGRVVMPTGDGIALASVSTSVGGAAVTDAQGFYSIRTPVAAVQEVTVAVTGTVSGRLFTGRLHVEEVAVGEVISVADIVAHETTRVEGRVVFSNGAVASAASVCLGNDCVMTNGDGEFVLLAQVPFGSTEALVSCDINKWNIKFFGDTRIEALESAGVNYIADVVVSPLPCLESPEWRTMGTGGGPVGATAGPKTLIVNDNDKQLLMYNTWQGSGSIVAWDGSLWTQIGGAANHNCIVRGPDWLGRGVITGTYTVGSGAQSYIRQWNGVQWDILIESSLLGNNDIDGLFTHDDGTGEALWISINDSVLKTYQPNAGIYLTHAGEWWLSGPYSEWPGSDYQYNRMTFASHDDGAGQMLYVGGAFNRVSLSSDDPFAVAFGVARWEGSYWEAVGDGLVGTVSVLYEFDDGSGPSLFAGGFFRESGSGVPLNGVARWNGEVWLPLGDGVEIASGSEPVVYDLQAFDDGAGLCLYAVGRFDLAGGVPVNNVAKWDGNAWQAVGSGGRGSGASGSYASVLEVFRHQGRSVLMMGGWFDSVDGVPAANTAQFGCFDSIP